MGSISVLLLVLVALAAGIAAGWLLRAGQVATLAERLKGQERLMDEKLSVLNEAREKLKEAFEALSSEALRSNNQSFLALAKATLETFQEGARGDLEMRQRSIDALILPMRDSLERVDSKIGELEKARFAADATLAATGSAKGACCRCRQTEIRHSSAEQDKKRLADPTAADR